MLETVRAYAALELDAAGERGSRHGRTGAILRQRGAGGRRLE
jgi:hypothetical protein